MQTIVLTHIEKFAIPIAYQLANKRALVDLCEKIDRRLMHNGM